MQSDPLFDIHPDMAELVAAKLAVPQSAEANSSRVAWNEYGARLQQPYPSGMVVDDTTFDVAGTTGRKIALRIYRPSNAPQPSPCVLYIHGGGFVKGSLESGDAIAWGIADQIGVVVVSVDYRLAPEHPYPAAVEDCYATAKYISARGPALGVDATRLAVWGDSAGGNLAAALCLMARDRREPRIVAQALNYPCLTDELSSGTIATMPCPQASRPPAWSATGITIWVASGRPTNPMRHRSKRPIWVGYHRRTFMGRD